jgi:hypothetical protein
VVAGLAALLASGRPAGAEPGACRAAIIKEVGRLTQTAAGALQACQQRVLKGKLPVGTVCRDVAKTSAAISKAASKLRTALARKCGGSDRRCDASGDDPLASIGWDVRTCPDADGAGCTTTIEDCDDVATCLSCTVDAAVTRGAALSYTPLQSASVTDKELTRCRRAIAGETAKLFAAKAAILERCWTDINEAGLAATCPEGDPRIPGAFARAEGRAQAKICKACGGPERRCGGIDDLGATVIGFPEDCLDVPGCGDTTVETVLDVVACVECATSFRARCLSALPVPWAGPYPAECTPGCGNGLREDAEECDGQDASACSGLCQADCRCAPVMPTVTTTTSTSTSCPTGTGASSTSTTSLPLPPCGSGSQVCEDVGCAEDQFCRDNCTCAPLPVCGNGVLEEGEECDPTGCLSGEECVEDCTCQVVMTCGNGRIDAGEECDGTGCPDGEECLASCTCSTTGLCGNGRVDPGEDCDFPGRCPGGGECPENCNCP